MLLPLTLALLTALAAPSPADRVAQAETLMAELEYAQAAELLDEALADERLVGPERVQAHMMAGVSNRILKRDVDAQLHFEHALKLDSTASLRVGQPPKIVTFFEMIRTRHIQAQAPPLEANAAPPPVEATPLRAAANEEGKGEPGESTSWSSYAAGAFFGLGAFAAVAGLVAAVAIGAIEVALGIDTLAVSTRAPLRSAGQGAVVAALGFGASSVLAIGVGAVTWVVGAMLEDEE